MSSIILVIDAVAAVVLFVAARWLIRRALTGDHTGLRRTAVLIAAAWTVVLFLTRLPMAFYGPEDGDGETRLMLFSATVVGLSVAALLNFIITRAIVFWVGRGILAITK